MKTAVTIGSRKGIVGPHSLANVNFGTASGYCSHSEGQSTTASGIYSHAEGENTIASGHASHSEGQSTTASGNFSHASGYKAQTKTGDSYAYSWNGDINRTEPYVSHGKGTYNINPTGGLDGIYIGEKKLSEVISDGVANKADKTELPTKVSQLENDNGYLTTKQVKLGTRRGYVANADHSVSAQSAVDSETVPWSGVKFRPTTLEGYGITDAATKTELETLAARVDAANTELEEIA